MKKKKEPLLIAISDLKDAAVRLRVAELSHSVSEEKANLSRGVLGNAKRDYDGVREKLVEIVTGRKVDKNKMEVKCWSVSSI